jgi:methyl-accepting chemotaxis protein
MTEPKGIQKTALNLTRWVGSPASIVTHTILFLASFATVIFGLLSFDRMLLVLTTIVSLEAIYLSLFIQMTINYTTDTIVEVEKDIDEIQGDIDEMQEDVEEIAEDVDELQEDVEDISEDVEEMTEEDKAEDAAEARHQKSLADIQVELHKLVEDIAKLQGK